MNISVVITSDGHENSLSGYVNELIENKINDIIIAGTRDESDDLKSLSEKKEVTILCENAKSTGAAIREAFEFLYKNRSGSDAAVFISGGACPFGSAVRDLMDAYEETPEKIIFAAEKKENEGSTAHKNKTHSVSSLIYRFAIGINLEDTRGRIRLIPSKYYEYFANLPGRDKGYESRMLIGIMNKKIPYREISIRAAKGQAGKTASFKETIFTYSIILAYFLKFAISSVSSYLIDMGIYAILLFFLESRLPTGSQVFICTLVSRLLSSLFNYTLNRKTVFKAKDNLAAATVRYYVLAGAKLAASYLLIYFFTELLKVTGFAQLIIKALVDIVLFLFSYQIQKNWVFRKKNV